VHSTGHQESNPFNFQNFGLSEIALYLDGQQQHTVKPIQPNYENGQYITPYDSMFGGTGKLIIIIIINHAEIIVTLSH